MSDERSRVSSSEGHIDHAAAGDEHAADGASLAVSCPKPHRFKKQSGEQRLGGAKQMRIAQALIASCR
jgi:hypothetical protein